MYIGAPNLLPAASLKRKFVRVGDGIVKNLCR